MLEKIFSKRKKENSKVMALKGINLVDGLSNELKKDMTIIIKEGKIIEIGKDNETTIPHDANVLKLSGKTVIPGLIDAHLHLLQSGVDDFMKPYAESAYKKLKRNSFINLKSGITTVRNMPGGFGYSALKFRDKINEGKILGPRILTSGPALAPSNGYFSLKQYITSNTLMLFILSRIFRAHGLSIDVDSKEEGRTVVRKLKRKGVDFIKTVTPGSFIPFAEKDEKLKEELLEKGMKLEQIKASMKPEVLQEIVNEAHKQGLKVAVHTISWPDDFKKAVKVGVDSIEHTPLGLIDKETFKMMKSKEIYWVPTAYCFYNWTNLIDNPEQYDTPKMKELIPEPFHSLGKKSLQKVREGIKQGNDPIWSRFYNEIEPFKEEYFPVNFRRALEEGIKIVAAVDGGVSGAAYVPHGQLYKELELYVDNGMNEFEAIQAATKNPAELLGIEKEVGSVEVGKVGDLVVLNDNPLEKISNVKNINCVIKDGSIAYKSKGALD